MTAALTPILDRLQTTERAIKAVGTLAMADGFLNVNRQEACLSMTRSDDLACLMEVLAGSVHDSLEKLEAFEAELERRGSML